MADTLKATQRALERARLGGNRERVAEAAVALADALTKRGQWREAVAALDEATTLNRELGRADREAQCLRMSSALCRFAGDLEDAARRARAALERVPPQDAVTASAWAELAEIAMARSHAADAETDWSHALAAGAISGVAPAGGATLFTVRPRP